MRVNVFPGYESVSEEVAAQVLDLVKKKPTAVICMASGDSPRRTCQLITERALREQIDFSRVTFIGLDEWVGIPPENEGSCHYFFKSLLLYPLNFSASQFRLFNALSEDLSAEWAAMDKMIFEKGGIDLMIVGIGMNGHIGFNEPGISFDKYSHVAQLDEMTTSVGQKYFKSAIALDRGITLGLKHLMEARTVILLANGKKKAEVIKRAVEGDVSNAFPASIIQQHADGIIMIDEEAASLLPHTV